MKLAKLTATALTITFVATVLIKADQFLSRDPLTQKEKDPVRINTSEVIEKEEINTDEIEQQSSESLLIEKIEKLTSRINELEAELINQQAEEEALKVENGSEEKISNEEEEALKVENGSEEEISNEAQCIEKGAQWKDDFLNKTSITVYYDPSNPSDNQYMEPTSPGENALTWGGGGLVVAVILFFVGRDMKAATVYTRDAFTGNPVSDESSK